MTPKTQNDSMPERYQPDPWVDTRVCAEANGRIYARIPANTLQWINPSIGDTLNAAPRTERAVTIGFETPNILCDFKLHSKRGKPARKLPETLIKYLGADSGNTLRFHKVDSKTFRVEVLK